MGLYKLLSDCSGVPEEEIQKIKRSLTNIKYEYFSKIDDAMMRDASHAARDTDIEAAKTQAERQTMQVVRKIAEGLTQGKTEEQINATIDALVRYDSYGAIIAPALRSYLREYKDVASGPPDGRDPVGNAQRLEKSLGDLQVTIVQSLHHNAEEPFFLPEATAPLGRIHVPHRSLAKIVLNPLAFPESTLKPAPIIPDPSVLPKLKIGGGKKRHETESRQTLAPVGR